MSDSQYSAEHEDFLRHRKEFELFQSKVTKYVPLEGRDIVDIGSSWGMHMGFIVNSNPRSLVGIDIADFIGHFQGDYKTKILDYYERHGCKLVSDNFQLVRSDGQRIALKSSTFDVAVTINCFEHIPDPELALLEIHRLLRPGGYAFICFIPLFNCDEGSHMTQFVKEPWAHLKYPEEEYLRLLREMTPGTEYFANEFKYGLNKRPGRYYIDIFNKYGAPLLGRDGFALALSRLLGRDRLFEIVEREEWRGVTDSSSLEHENFVRLQEKYPAEELLFRGMYVLLRKC